MRPISIALTLAFCLLGSVLHAQQPDSTNKGFADITEAAGIQHQFQVYEGMFGGGICVFDLNNDGFEDLYLTGGMNEDQLYLNQGNGTFRNVFEGSGLEITRRFVTQGVAGADVNRDGWVDLFITTITAKDSGRIIPRARNLFFLNDGDGTFTDATEAFGLIPLYSFSTGPSFGDFNADGWPDLYVGNYFQEYMGELTSINDATIVGANQTAKSYLLLNEGGKAFRDVYTDYGMKHRGFGFGGLFTDFDNDGDLDLLVHHDFGYKATPSLLYRNDHPRERFTEVGKEFDMDLKINAMAAANGDINHDGMLDYFITNIRFNRFMVSQGPGKPYREELKERGMTFVTISWGANFADFDHDGELELFVANGDLNPNCTPMADFYFDQNPDGSFTDRAHLVGLNDYGIGRGTVVFDLENDGDLDILTINQAPVMPGYPVASTTRLFRNDLADGNWLQIVLKGKQSDLHGLGARIKVVAGGKTFLREIDGGGSTHMSQNSSIAHIGLGEAEIVDSLVITWVGGHEQVLLGQPVNTRLNVEESPHEERPVWPWILVGALGGLLAAGFAWKRAQKRRSDR